MKKRVSAVLAAVAMLITASANIGCVLWWFDEPKALEDMD